MYIRANVRGTNQHSKKGRLMECVICEHCGAFNDEYEPYQEVNGFISPHRERNTECHKCKGKLQTIHKEI